MSIDPLMVPTPSVKINLEKITVLVVDSNEFSRNFTCGLCREFKFEKVLSAATTTEAMNLLLAHSVQLIISDWDLVPQTGEEFVRQVRFSEQIRSSASPIIVITTGGIPENVKTARDVGVSDFLTRPIPVKRLLNSLLTVLSASRAYVKSKNYIGPCRRRKQAQFECQERRKDLKSFIRVHPDRFKISEKIKQPGGLSFDELEKVGAAVISDRTETYGKVQLRDIDELFDLSRQLKDPLADMQDIVKKIYTKSSDLRGLGTTFGHPILTEVCALLCEFVRDADPESFKKLPKLQVVETHVMIMKTIVASIPRDAGGPLATELMGELHEMADKFKNY